MFKISFSNIFIIDSNFAGLCENVNNFSKDGIFASDREIQSAQYAKSNRIGAKNSELMERADFAIVAAGYVG